MRALLSLTDIFPDSSVFDFPSRILQASLAKSRSRISGEATAIIANASLSSLIVAQPTWKIQFQLRSFVFCHGYNYRGTIFNSNHLGKSLCVHTGNKTALKTQSTVQKSFAISTSLTNHQVLPLLPYWHGFHHNTRRTIFNSNHLGKSLCFTLGTRQQWRLDRSNGDSIYCTKVSHHIYITCKPSSPASSALLAWIPITTSTHHNLLHIPQQE